MGKRLSALFVLIGGTSYGLLATLVVLAYGEGYRVGEITGSQFLAGALILWTVALLKKKTWRRMKWQAALWLILAGTLSGLTGIFYYSAMQTIPASIAIVLLFQFTWVGALYAWLFDRQKPSRRMVVSLSVVLLGTLLAADMFSTEFQTFSVMGLLFGLLSAFTYAGFVYVSGRLATEVSPWLRSPLMVTGATIVILLLFPPSFFVSGVLAAGLWKYTLSLAFLGAIVPTVCFTIGAPQLSGGAAVILSSVELPVAVVMAWIILGEAVNLWQWVGVALILIAISIGEVHAGPISKRQKTVPPFGTNKE